APPKRVGGRRRVCRAGVLEHLDDLPHIEARSDHPGASTGIIATECDAREAPSPRGLLGKGFDDCALRASCPPRLRLDELLCAIVEAHAEWLALGHRVSPTTPTTA